MKFGNKIKRLLIFAVSSAIIICCIPFGASASAYTEKYIFTYLVYEMGLNPAAACGVLANIEYESEFDFNQYGDYGTSYGICQWHNERWDTLEKYCNYNGLDWTSLYGQLRFLEYELTYRTEDTGRTLSKLRNVENSADGAYEAATIWCYDFERPANVSYQAEKRGTSARDYYWPVYRYCISVGDVNMDYKISTDDALYILNYAVGRNVVSYEQFYAADINGNGWIESGDALTILNIVVGNDNIYNYR